MKLIDRDTNKDAILAYLRSAEANIEDLSEKQQQLLKYYMDGYALRRNYNSMPDAINILVKLAAGTGHPISQSTARRYIIEGQEIFGDVNKLSKQAATQYALSVLEDAISMARDQNDPKTMAIAAGKYADLATKEEPELFDPEMMEQHIIEISMDPKSLKVFDTLASKGSVDLDLLMGNLMDSIAVDAEIIPDNDGN